LTVFGACSFVSFVSTLWPRHWWSDWLSARWPHLILQVVGCVAGFFIASYTGALLSATNQPMWSDTVWLAPLFLASAASTSLATLSLIARLQNVGTPAARERLEVAEPWAPEEHRQPGEPGADTGNHPGEIPYRSKLPREP